ncbi:DNA-directed RNA polymerase subunit beta' [Erythrobacter rubeus]|uniref:DNA-directed RNA polymerase subunit beta n=1 Tax=Erythrobacter rubeus TaxID=2760803 RepID=A0ABR8KZ31_9SPHN|nr:DNA-directed RNA polymerase subunit beta' [Erythrobacter rubeus]MBD2843476.1 DNA-directed RNA polymerase subunit beta' [Erythrobacter rubeus]
MPHKTTPSAARRSTIARLAEPPQISGLSPQAARFVYSLRLIALHDRAWRDPVPELAVRLGSVEVAARALALSQAISSCWPEAVHVSRFCCQLLSHDEMTIGSLIDCAVRCDRPGFEGAIAGLVRPDRVHRMWEAVLGLVAAEANAAPSS